MNIEIIDKQLALDVYGFSATATDRNYTATAFKLMDRMWQAVKQNNLSNKGRNIWIYDTNDKVFAGVELEGSPKPEITLEFRKVILDRYAYYKHIGPCHLIKERGQSMKDELQRQGLKIISPYIEIYGHWTNDETKLETELLMAIA